VPPPEQRDPSERYSNVKKDSETHDAWGSGDGGFKIPRRIYHTIFLLFNLVYKFDD